MLGYRSDEVFTLRLAMYRRGGSPGEELVYIVEGTVDRVGWAGERQPVAFSVPKETLRKADGDFRAPLADYLSRVTASLREEIGAFAIPRSTREVACEPARECGAWRLETRETELAVSSSHERGGIPLADLVGKSTEERPASEVGQARPGDAYDIFGWVEYDLGARRAVVVTVGTGDRRRFKAATAEARCMNGEICATLPGIYHHGENYDVLLIGDAVAEDNSR